MTKSEWQNLVKYTRQEPMYQSDGDAGSILRALANVCQLMANTASENSRSAEGGEG